MKWKVQIPVYIEFKTYGQMLRFSREQKGITQAQLAKKLKTKQSAIARMENSKRAPSLRKIEETGVALAMAMLSPKFVCKKCHKDIQDCKCK